MGISLNSGTEGAEMNACISTPNPLSSLRCSREEAVYGKSWHGVSGEGCG